MITRSFSFGTPSTAAFSVRIESALCEHLGLHETTRSQKFIELARRTDVTALAAHVERTMDNNQNGAARR